MQIIRLFIREFPECKSCETLHLKIGELLLFFHALQTAKCGSLNCRRLLFQRDELITRMKISDLKPGMRGVNIEGNVENITETRSVNLKSGGMAQVADAVISDETGSIKLSLWDDQLNMVKEGDRISVENGYTQEFRGETSLNVGRYGKLNKL